MNGAMFNSLARFIDKNYPQVSFSDICRKASLNTSVFAELTWYPDDDLPNMMDALSEQTEIEPSTLWREFGRETFAYFADIFGDYMGEVVNFSDLITAVNRIHQTISRDGLGTPPRLEFRKAQPDHFEIRYFLWFIGVFNNSKFINIDIEILHHFQSTICPTLG